VKAKCVKCNLNWNISILQSQGIFVPGAKRKTEGLGGRNHHGRYHRIFLRFISGVLRGHAGHSICVSEKRVQSIWG